MVVVDVEDGDPFDPRVPGRLGDDARVVEVAVAAVDGPGDVVARRPAEPVGGRLAAEHRVERAEGDVDRPASGVVRALDERRGRVEHPRAERTDAAGRRPRRTHAVPQRWVEERVRRHLRRTGARFGNGSRPGDAEVLDHGFVVHGPDRVEPVGRRVGQLEASVGHQRGPDRLGPGRHLVDVGRPAVHHLGARGVAKVLRRVDDPHAR